MRIALFALIFSLFSQAFAQSSTCRDFECITCEQATKLENVCRLNVETILAEIANPDGPTPTFQDTSKIFEVYSVVRSLRENTTFPQFLMDYSNRKFKELSEKPHYNTCSENMRTSLHICIAQLNGQPAPIPAQPDENSNEEVVAEFVEQ